jgi:hypothetical protein
MMAKSMVEIVIDAKDQFSGVMNKANSRMKDISASARKAGLVLGAMGGAGIIAGKNFIDAALEQQKALKTLSAVVEHTGVSFASVREEIEATTAAIEQKTNFSDEQQIRAMSRLVPILGNVDQALEALPLVLDAASASGLGVESVAGTLARALSGMVHTSESIGVTFDANATFAERMAIGFAKVGGAAEANADPFTQLGNTVNTLKERIGDALIPVVMPLIAHFTTFIERLQTLNPQVIRIAALVGFAAVAFAVVAAPILLLIGLLPVLVAGFGTVFASVGALMALFAVFVSWPALIALAFGALALAMIRNWGGIRDKFIEMVNWILKGFAKLVNETIGHINWLIRQWNKVTWGDPIDEIGEVSLEIKQMMGVVGDGVEWVADKVGGFKDKAIELMKELPAKVVPFVDKMIVKFNELTGESLPLLSDIIATLKENVAGLFETLEKEPPVGKAPGEAAADGWKKAQEAHEAYQRSLLDALSRYKASTDTRMSGHEIALRQYAIYQRSIAGGGGDSGMYGGTSQSFLDVLRSGSTILSEEEKSELAKQTVRFPITLVVEGEPMSAILEQKVGQNAAKVEAMGGA